VPPGMLHLELFLSVAYPPGGKLVATASFDGTARLWDAATGKPVGPPMFIEKNLSLRAIAFSPDGKTLVAGAPRGPGTAMWDVPEPATGDVKQLVTSISVQTGIELDPSGLFHMLDAERWSQLRRQLPSSDVESAR